MMYSDETAALIIRDFSLKTEKEKFSEQELFDLLADHVAYMIEYRLDFLLSLMYRLDIKEEHINQVLQPNSAEPANTGLTRLIIERQKQRIFTKQKYKQPKLDLDDLSF